MPRSRKPSAAAIPARLYLHCGWAIVVDRDLESVIDEDGETLRLHDDRREVCLGSMKLTPHDGKPLKAVDILKLYPPPDMAGLRLEHHVGDLHGSAIQMEAADDEDGSVCWVLMAMLFHEPTSTVLRCTITVARSDYREWAILAWRSIFYYGRDPERLEAQLEALGLTRELIRSGR